MLKTRPKVFYFNSDLRKSSYLLKEQLIKMFCEHNLIERDVILLCIGSDRSTGDSLGPLVGHKLSCNPLPQITVYGTLNDPVHAANLKNKISIIEQNHYMPFIIAVDASLGTMEHVGYVTVSNGPLHPGLGVNKTLPGIGDMHITGIVNFSGMMESLLLQTTRLSRVMLLADLISRSIRAGFAEYMNLSAQSYSSD